MLPESAIKCDCGYYFGDGGAPMPLQPVTDLQPAPTIIDVVPPPSNIDAQPSNTETHVDRSPEEFYKALVGTKNLNFYLRHFSHFDSNGRVGASWHWPAFFVTVYWLLYRKMWRNALIYFFLSYIAILPIVGVALSAGSSAAAVIAKGYIWYLIAIFVLAPMYANALYYNHCRKIIAQTSASRDTQKRMLGKLAARGGTAKVIRIVAVVVGMFFFFGILAAVSIPARPDYTARSKVSEALLMASNCRNIVTETVQSSSTLPGAGQWGCESSSSTPQISKYVKSIETNAAGEIRIQVTGIDPTNIDGNAIILQPSRSATSPVAPIAGFEIRSWLCGPDPANGKDILKYLVGSCRSTINVYSETFVSRDTPNKTDRSR